jgi:hypothetical protein
MALVITMTSSYGVTIETPSSGRLVPEAVPDHASDGCHVLPVLELVDP